MSQFVDHDNLFLIRVCIWGADRVEYKFKGFRHAEKILTWQQEIPHHKQIIF